MLIADCSGDLFLERDGTNQDTFLPPGDLLRGKDRPVRQSSPVQMGI
jgi:hypothetical protein